ncbi:MAG: sensor histidine kinase N-terminal domain-containing protein [Rhodospirillales bacterium]|nr:sensor histidine kinase N-terminal domain-containing protein [Rhodospirillales bacterium]
MSRTYSIRKRLILLISLPILLSALMIGILSLMSAYDEIEEIYDAQMAHASKVLLQLTQHEILEDQGYEIELGPENTKPVHRYEKKLTFRIWEKDHLVTESDLARDFRSFRAPQGYSDQTLNGTSWRFFVFYDPETQITIEVAEKEEVRQELILKILAGLLAPLSIFFPLVMLIIWLGVTWSLNPLTQLSEQVDLRESNDFSPISSPFMSEELQPLIRAFNRLLERIKQTFSREQAFTDNAAHELRTPLAAMKTQTQVLLKKIKTEEYKEDFQNLVASIDRATHMVDQLLNFARLQSDQQLEFEDVSLHVLLDDTISEYRNWAQQKNITLTYHGHEGSKIRGNEHALELMLRNLLDNALKYTPSGGIVDVSQRQGKDHTIALVITDTGPGIPDTEKKRVFERFYRVKKNADRGSGLGLAMVRWVCDIHGASINLSDNQPRGLTVHIEFKTV